MEYWTINLIVCLLCPALVQSLPTPHCHNRAQEPAISPHPPHSSLSSWNSPPPEEEQKKKVQLDFVTNPSSEDLLQLQVKSQFGSFFWFESLHSVQTLQSQQYITLIHSAAQLLFIVIK